MIGLFLYFDLDWQIKEFYELFENVPIEYLPVMQKDGTPIILVVKANKANNPGNSVFGPKGPSATLFTPFSHSSFNLILWFSCLPPHMTPFTGMICPGNIVTSMLMKSVADLKRQFRIKIDGKIELQSGLIKRMCNPDQVFITFLERVGEEANL